MIYLLKIIISAVLFALLDYVWIGIIMKSFYTRMLEPVIGTLRLNIIPATTTYLFLGLGVAIFVAPISKSPTSALIYGALLGLITYGVYDATNTATMARWPIQFAVADVLWGTIATGLVSFVIYTIFSS